MSQATGRNQFPPTKEDKDFLSKLLWQGNNHKLINYIASNFNSIPQHYLRKLKVGEWIYAINWLKNKFTYYDSPDFDQFCKNHFDGENFIDEYLLNLYKASDILEMIEGFDDIEMVGDKTFFSNEIYEESSKVFKQNQEDRANEFFNYDLNKKLEILSVYDDYREAAIKVRNDPNTNFWDVNADSINLMIKDKLGVEYNTDQNIDIVYKTCEKLIQSNTNKNKFVTDEELTKLLNDEIYFSNNLTLTAYYIQYILMSLGLIIPKNKNVFGVSKLTGKQAEIMQRLLCGITTKRWDRVEQKSNTYYQTIYNMFKLDLNDKWAIKNLLKQLDSVKSMLSDGKFLGAIWILEEDIEKIKALEIEK